MNVCTHSYSLVWYDWASWQSLIDNMALRGINMVLALTGQEEIQYKIFSKLGLKDHDIRSWFNGPAFLTWSRGQNEYGSGIAGPLPRSFMKNQWALQKEHILPRLRSLGMVGILPAFQGNVPIQLKDLYKDANITQQEDTGWMDALDPLYAKVADMWMTELIEDFGTDHYYQLDGWFNGGVPPWMRNEKNQQQTNHTKQHQQQETTAATQRRSLAAVADKTTTTQEEPMVSKLLTHDEGWYKRGQAAYSGLNRTDPDAVWMYQGFAFVDWSTPKQASYVKGFVDSVPLGNFIVIDMTYSQDGEWQKWGNASFFGAVSSAAQCSVIHQSTRRFVDIEKTNAKEWTNHFVLNVGPSCFGEDKNRNCSLHCVLFSQHNLLFLERTVIFAKIPILDANQTALYLVKAP